MEEVIRLIKGLEIKFDKKFDELKDDIRKTREDMHIMEQRLNKRIDDVEERLNKRIDDVEEKLNKKIDDVEERLNKKIDDVSEVLNERINGLEKDVKGIKFKVDVIYEKLAKNEEYKTSNDYRYNAIVDDVQNMKTILVREPEENENSSN